MSYTWDTGEHSDHRCAQSTEPANYIYISPPPHRLSHTALHNNLPLSVSIMLPWKLFQVIITNAQNHACILLAGSVQDPDEPFCRKESRALDIVMTTLGM